jgi:hypothetical protein
MDTHTGKDVRVCMISGSNRTKPRNSCLFASSKGMLRCMCISVCLYLCIISAPTFPSPILHIFFTVSICEGFPALSIRSNRLRAYTRMFFPERKTVAGSCERHTHICRICRIVGEKAYSLSVFFHSSILRRWGYSQFSSQFPSRRPVYTHDRVEYTYVYLPDADPLGRSCPYWDRSTPSLLYLPDADPLRGRRA